MAQTYSIEFKEEACKRVQSGIPGGTGSKGTRNQCKYPIHMDVPV